MKTNYIIVIIIILLQSCGVQLNKEYLANISTKYRDFDLLMVIPVDSSGKVINVCISNTELFLGVFTNQKNSHYKDFSKFLQNSYNPENYIKYNAIKDLPHKIINPKANIFTLHKEKGFNNLIGGYLKKEGENFSSVYSLDEDDKYGLIQIMFENNYYISWNDYRALFVFTKQIKSQD